MPVGEPVFCVSDGVLPLLTLVVFEFAPPLLCALRLAGGTSAEADAGKDNRAGGLPMGLQQVENPTLEGCA